MAKSQKTDQAEATILRLVAYRYAHHRGRLEIEAEKRKATKTQVGELASLRKKAKKELNLLLQTGNVKHLKIYKTLQAQIAELSAQLSEVRRPYNEKKRPLNMAVRFLDRVIPPKLEEAGYDVSPRTEIAGEVAALIASAKARKAEKAKKAKKAK